MDKDWKFSDWNQGSNVKLAKYTLESTQIVVISMKLDTLAGPSTGNEHMISCIHLGSIRNFKSNINRTIIFFDKTTNNPKHSLAM